MIYGDNGPIRLILRFFTVFRMINKPCSMIGEVRKMQSYSFFILNSRNNQEYTTGKIDRSRFFYFLRDNDNVCSQWGDI